MSLPFQGETMTCIMSGAKKRSNSNASSNWDCVMVDGVRYYVSNKWREKSYKKRGVSATYQLIIQKIMELRGGA